MNKSEKSFYVIIENKKCGKFSGVSQIQVAKKVASKKLKSKKKMEITFHLDEVGGKKKRYGPYQGRKDKKTGKVVVVKGGKVMKGGVLTADDITELQIAFSKNCNITLNQGQRLLPRIQKRIINISFRLIAIKPLIFFNGNSTFHEIEYKYAVFEDTNGNIWIFFKNTYNQVLYNNFFEFFLNPEIIQTNFDSLMKYRLIEVLDNLINNGNNPIPAELKRIINEATKISTILGLSPESTESIIYFPNYSESKIKKCVYPDLTFGIFDEKNLYNEGTIPPPPQSVYQRFLIRRQPFFVGFSEPVIFLRIPPLLNNTDMKLNNTDMKLNNTDMKFDLYISKKNGKLRITINSLDGSEYDFSSTNSTNLFKIQNIEEYCRFLVSIPLGFGNFKTVKNTANDLIQKLALKPQQQSFALQPQQQSLALQQQQQQLALQQKPFTLQQKPFTLQPQPLSQQQRNQKENMEKRQLNFIKQQNSIAKIIKEQKIIEQKLLLKKIDDLEKKLEQLKIEQNRQNRQNRQSVFSRSFISSMNKNSKLKPTNIPTIETEIKQIKQQLINSMQSG